MELKTPKDLKALADACRKAGIYEFKGFGVEFTLSDRPEAPRRRAKAPEASQTPPTAFERKVKEAQATPEELEPSTPSEEEIMFWSSGGAPKDGEDDGAMQ